MLESKDLHEILKRCTPYQWDSIKWMIPTARCRMILVSRCRLHQTQAETARKYGVSPERIRQIYHKGLRSIIFYVNRLKDLGQYDFLINPKPMLSIHETPVAIKLDLPLQYIDLPERVRNCFICMGAKTIRDVVAMSESDLMAFKNFGRKSLLEVKQRLEYLGLSLRK